MIGSFLLGFLMQVGLATPVLSPTLRLALTTGVMGGFTTYSTFNYETMRYVQDGAWGLACGERRPSRWRPVSPPASRGVAAGR